MMTTRLIVSRPAVTANGLYQILCGFLEMESCVVQDGMLRITGAVEAGMSDQDWDTPRPTMSVIGAIARGASAFVTAMGCPDQHEPLCLREGDVELLDVTERDWRTIAVQSRESVYPCSYLRNISTLTVLCTAAPVDLGLILPNWAPELRRHRWHGLGDLESMMHAPEAVFAVGARDTDYLLPVEALAKDEETAEKAFATICELADPLIVEASSENLVRESWPRWTWEFRLSE